MKTRALGLALAASLFGTGCYSTTIKNGSPPGQTPFGWEERWHGGFIWGIAEASGPYNLQGECPGSWAEIRTETGFWNGLVGALTRDIYSPQTVALTCAHASPSAAAAPAAGPPTPPPVP